MSRMAQWNGTPSYATKKQLVSSISGLYDDLQDFQFSTISAVSTLNVSEWISAPVLYVSDIKGANIDISGIKIDASGVLFAPLLSSQTGNFSIVNISTLRFEFNPTFSGDIKVSFDLGLGQAIGGLLGGLGAAVGGAFIGIGTGLGLIIQGAEQGIATMVAGRPQNYINNNVYETINFTSQLQISTLGNAYPLYSTIIRTVSSPAANEVPGQEIFLSSFITPGTTCIRTVSDPFNLISGNSNLNTSTLQSFGQWVAFQDSTPAGEDIVARNASFSTVSIAVDAPPEFGILQPPLEIYASNTIYPNISSEIYPFPQTTFLNQPYTPTIPIQQLFFPTPVFENDTYFNYTITYISTPFVQFQSTLTTQPSVYFITSSISTPALFTWNGATTGNFAICEPDETGFRSTATFDFRAISQDLVIQWGLSVDNRNSTIGAGTGKRVTWDNDANTSNFIDIPVPQSTIANEPGIPMRFSIEATPYEVRLMTDGAAGQNTGFKINASTMVVGLGFGDSSASNQPGYAYQFNGNTYIGGTLEATTIIAVSNITAVSTFVQTLFSTNVLEAASGIFTSTQTTKAYMNEGYISCLKSTNNFANDYITAKSRMRLAGYDTPLAVVVGTSSNLYDPSVRFDFNTSQLNNSFFITAQPANQTIASFTQSNVQISNLAVGNLTAGTLVYSNAEAPYLQTSTIQFGWTGNFSLPTPISPSLSQSLVTPPGVFWNNYAAASNQVLNIMSFSNSVNMLAQQFSTPLAYVNTTFDGTNRQGWASTIFFNSLTTPARVNLGANAGVGELSLQSQTNGIVVSLNTNPGGVGGVPIPVPIGSTYKFTSGGSSWTTTCNAPTPGTIQYTNALNLSMDFENLYLSTSDTLNINAEKINLNGQVVVPNLQLENILLNGYLSTPQVRADSINGYKSDTIFTGSYNAQPIATPLNLTYTVNSTDFITIRQAVTPSRGFNLFNSFNFEEWNNTQYNIDTTTILGRPTMIVGEVLQLSPPVAAYAGQFWVNNTIDSPALVIPIYRNIEGGLSQIGAITGGTYGRVYTNDGTNWFVQSNVPSPQGVTPTTYDNYYQVQMNASGTTINSGMPLIYNNPSLTYYNNKTFFFSPQIRVATIDAPSFNTREAGFENVFYYDSNVIFSFQGGIFAWESAAFNPIINLYSNSYYSIAGWEVFASMTRFRGDGDTLVLAWDIEPTPYPVGGGAQDFIWGSKRYIQVRAESTPKGNLRESYLVCPKNYFNFIWQGQGAIN